MKSRLRRHLHAVKRLSICVALLAGLFLTGCVNTDKLTFLNYANNPGSPNEPPKVSDGLAINFANSMEVIMRSNATGSRVTRDIAATAQVGLAAFSGVGAAFNYSATTLAALGMSSAGIPQLQQIFNAKARAETYNQAANMIQDAVMSYYEHNTIPSSEILTPNGLTLVKVVSSAVNLVDNTLTGILPSTKQMKQAVEEMTPAGTQKQDPAAAPVNVSVPAALLQPPRAPETVTKAQMQKLQADMARLQTNKPAIIEFVSALRAYDRSPALTAPQKTQGYTQILIDAGLQGKVQADKNSINTYYQESATPQEMEALTKAINKELQATKQTTPLPQ